MTDEPVEIAERPLGIYLASIVMAIFAISFIVSSGYWYFFYDPGPDLPGIENIFGTCVLINAVVALWLVPPIFKGSTGSNVAGILYSVYIGMFIVMFPGIISNNSVWLFVALGLIIVFIASLAFPSSWKFSEQGRGKRLYRTLLEE